MIVAGIDAGGTSWKLITASGPDDILARTTIPTTTPDETVAAAAAWINAQHAKGHAIGAIGLASFGPIDRDPESRSTLTSIARCSRKRSGARARVYPMSPMSPSAPVLAALR
jgi:predicted NBD/HSP70 family sugar kinase